MGMHVSSGTAIKSVPTADVCLIVEGCYPHVSGGVSSWIDWLMRTQQDRTFAVVSIVTGREPRRPRYKFPGNLVHICELDLHDLGPKRPPFPRRLETGPTDGLELAQPLIALASGGGLAEIARLNAIVNRPGHALAMRDLVESECAFDVVRRMYGAVMPHASFLQFYWAWRALFSGLFATLKFDLPKADVYHAISTGYAGLLAARAAIQSGRPAVLTEHGIYTNERRIDILMADWISDTVEKGLALDDARVDLRDFWIKVFEGYARTCYQACSVITTLYRDNQQLQLVLGARPEKLKIIANGIDVTRFETLAAAAPDARPTMALIGRVVPIKDVKTFIAAAAIARKRLANLRALVLGPTDEDPAYFEECRRLVADLDLADCVTFTGSVQITDFMASIHVVVLTSLSEAQPLVLLEAGAAGIPCVATNVGACREIIDGVDEGGDAIEPGGFFTDLVAPEQIADAICRLLGNEALRRRLGDRLRQRVRNHYASDIARQRYSSLYLDLLARPTTELVAEGA